MTLKPLPKKKAPTAKYVQRGHLLGRYPENEDILYAIANELAEANKTLKKIEENTRPI